MHNFKELPSFEILLETFDKQRFFLLFVPLTQDTTTLIMLIHRAIAYVLAQKTKRGDACLRCYIGSFAPFFPSDLVEFSLVKIR